MTLDPRLLAAYLRQRGELGEKEIVFPELERREVLRLLAAVRTGVRAEVKAPAGHGQAHAQRLGVESEAGASAAGDVVVGGVAVEELVRAPMPGGPSTASRPGLDPTRALNVLREDAIACTRCGLRHDATQVVFGDGLATAEVVVVGEAPGADEDRSGVPFVGRAGKMLDLLLESVGFPRERVYICNVLKCRPPNNRTPAPAEAANCREYLDGQLALVDPDYIVCWGSVAAQNLLGTTAPIGRLRGKLYQHGRAKVLCTYHPSYLLRNPAAKKDVWDDLKFLMRDMGVEL